MQQLYCLHGRPIGISTSESIIVEGHEVEEKIIVTKDEIVKKLIEKDSPYVEHWKRTTLQQFEFLKTECTKTES